MLQVDIHRFKQLNGASGIKTLNLEVKADPERQKEDKNEQIILGDAVSQKIETKPEISSIVDNKINIYPCKVCKIDFISKENLIRHVKVDHKETQKFQCEKCNHSFV